MRFDPPEELQGEFITLRKYRPSDADALKGSISASYEHLRGWMWWAQQPPTDESVLAFLSPSVQHFGGEADANYAVTLTESGEYVGGCGLMPRIGEGALEIGYWVDVRHLRQGIAAEAARLLTEAALNLDGIERVEIHCDEANTRSAGIPRRLGFHLDRVESDPPPSARSPEVRAPNETGRSMVWVADRDSWPATEDLLPSQTEYYRARAAEYDEWFYRQGRCDRGPEVNEKWFREVGIAKEALARFEVRGRVLEIACGTGIWTELLVPRAEQLVALDAAPEMLQACREKVGERENVEYVQADIFSWRPEQRFDLIFFAYWLSHVLPERFERFWEIVGDCLVPGGQVFFIDALYDETSTAIDHELEGPEATSVLRRLNDGREFRVVKVFCRPEDLERRLRGTGWDIRVRTTGSFVLFGNGGRVKA